MPSIFSRIASGEISSYKVAESEDFFAFLDINPVAIGHVLVIPRKEVDYIFDMDSDLFKNFWAFSQKIAVALKQVVPCLKIGIAVIGLEVPHAHIHLVPMNTMSDIDFQKKKLNLKPEELQEIADKITKKINDLA